MKKYVTGFIVLLFIFLAANTDGISTPARSMKEAKRLVFFCNYKSALPYLQQVYRSDTSNAYFNYLLGYCMYNIPSEKQNSIPYLQRATRTVAPVIKEWSVKEVKAPEKAWLYYAMALQYSYRFSQAVPAYKEYGKICPGAEKKMVDHYIYCCESGMELLKDSIEITIDNLGEILNGIL